MANDEPMPKWRNFAAWSLVGAIFTLAVWGGIMLLQGGGIMLLQGDGMSATLPSKNVAASLGLGLILVMAVIGFTGRKRPISLRNLRNFLIQNALALTAFLLVIWGFSALARTGALGAMGASEWVAALTGSVIVFFAVLGTFVVASAHTSADLIEDEVVADDLRERSRLYVYSLVWMAACGLLLIVLGLAGPGGALSPAVALAGALLLVAVLAVLWIATWRLSDELMRTLSYETGNMTFYLILVLGGGWAILAHLGFVAAPAPLDWLTLCTVLLFVASFIALGRRRLLRG